MRNLRNNVRDFAECLAAIYFALSLTYKTILAYPEVNGEYVRLSVPFYIEGERYEIREDVLLDSISNGLEIVEGLMLLADRTSMFDKNKIDFIDSLDGKDRKLDPRILRRRIDVSKLKGRRFIDPPTTQEYHHLDL